MLKHLPKALIAINVVAAASCIALAAKFIVTPWVTEMLYREDYKVKMAACDAAMRTHLIAKNRVNFEKSEGSLRRLEAAEIGLIQCHEYDKLRKDMISLGLSSNDLARIGLEAIEERSVDIESLVEIHEFKY